MLDHKFGLKYAPIYFQESMDNASKDMLYNSKLVFIDDLVSWGVDDENYLKNVEKILQGCRELRLKLRADKTFLRLAEVEAVGHVLTPAGRHISTDKVSTIRSLPSPKNKTEFSVMGYIKNFHEYIPDCALNPNRLLSTSHHSYGLLTMSAHCVD